MKEFNLNIDLTELNLNEEDKKKPAKDIISVVISNTIYTYSTQMKGLLQAERKLFYTISTVLENTVKSDSDLANFEDGEWGFIKKCFRETKLTPSALLKKVEEAIELVSNR
jgi:hypothetical protein